VAVSSGVSSRWVTKRAVSLHLTLALVLPGFAALTWWQVRRAISGNTLSYVYSFEWPLFGAYAVYLWWKLVHEAPSPSPQGASEADAGRTARAGAPPVEERPKAADSLTRSPQDEACTGGDKGQQPLPDQGTNGDPAGRPAAEGAPPSAALDRGAGAAGEGPAGEGPADEGPADEELADEELAAYNRYLAELASSGARKQLFSPRKGRRRS
jgi:DNA-binding transcriptional regulator of glucitol operon